MKTIISHTSTVDRKWHVLNAEGLVLGKVATKVAHVLRGKHKPIYTPHVENGDGVIIVNAEKIVLTGRKLGQKKYFRYCRHLGNVKERTAGEMLEKSPGNLLKKAVAGMIPRNRHRATILKRLKVFVGPEHEHTAQSPVPLTL